MDEIGRRQVRVALTVLGYTALGLFGLYVVWLVRGIIAPLFVAFILAIVLAPVVDRLEARRVPRAVATAIVYLMVVGAIAVLVFVLAPLVSEQIGQIVDEFRRRFHLDEPGAISATVTEQIKLFGRQNAIPRFVMEPIVRQAKGSASLLTNGLEAFATLLVGLLPGLIWLVIVPLIAFYALVDYHRIFAKFLLLIPRKSRDSARDIASDVTAVFGKYLRGLGIVCALDAIVTTFALMAFPAVRPYAAALGLIAGLLYAVPYLGAIISTTLIALVALVAPGGSPGLMLTVTISMIVLHQVILDQIVSPRILGGQVGLHPILSIMALTAGNALFGIGGMLVAVPVAASLQIIVIHIAPRLARPVNVAIQTEEPAPVLTPVVTGDGVTVAAGQGVTGIPHTSKEDAAETA